MLLALGRSLDSLPSDIANGIKSGKVRSLMCYAAPCIGYILLFCSVHDINVTELHVLSVL